MHFTGVTVGYDEMHRREKNGLCLRCGKPAAKRSGMDWCMRCERREHVAWAKAVKEEEAEIAASVAAIKASFSH